MEKLMEKQASDLREQLLATRRTLLGLYFNASLDSDLKGFTNQALNGVEDALDGLKDHTEEPCKVFDVEVTETKTYYVRVRARTTEEARECFENNEHIIDAMEASDRLIEVTDCLEERLATTDWYNLNAEEETP